MGSFKYKDNFLFVEEVNLHQLSLEFPTPFYCYSLSFIKRQYGIFEKLFNFKPTLIAYALKANSNHTIVNELAQLGSGADVVSGWEVKKALDAGIHPTKIVFSGIGKTEEEIILGLKVGIKQFNIESLSELASINAIAQSLGKKANIAVRIKPGVQAETHHKISTGQTESKFGIGIEEAKQIISNISNFESINLCGLSCHIGSQITTIEPFKAAFTILVNFAKECIANGTLIQSIDFGGGIGIQYSKETPIVIEEYAQLIKNLIYDLDIEVIIEPGRFIIGNSGVLISKVLYRKVSESNQPFLIIDAGMNDFIRPTLYDAAHNILTIKKKSSSQEAYAVVGPVCESGDIFGRGIVLEKLEPGDNIALMGVGAYGYSMASNYNLRPKPAEVLVSGQKYAQIRTKQDYENYSALEIMPQWI